MKTGTLRTPAAGTDQLTTRGKTLAEVGSIHFSNADQVTPVANAIYRGVHGLVLLVIDPPALLPSSFLEREAECWQALLRSLQSQIRPGRAADPVLRHPIS